MMGLVAGFGEQLRSAALLAADGPSLMEGVSPSRIYVAGMGGSAIGGDYLRALMADRCPTPVEVVRSYTLPAGADPSAFVFFVSYSGNTEEVLSCWAEARTRGVPGCAVTSGGALAEAAAAAGVPTLRIPGGLPPRAALGWTSVPLLHAVAEAGLIEQDGNALEEAATVVEEIVSESGPHATGENRVAQWAERAARGLPMIYASAGLTAPGVTRWVCQLNENAKLLAHGCLLPEQNHNEIVGWEVPSRAGEMAEVAFLNDSGVHPRVRLRMEIVAASVEAAGGRPTWFSSRGQSAVARLYSLSILGDLASLWAASARSIDPTPVDSIVRLKQDLASAEKRG
jgi:glucose/mannose-6-phosphate isomerase